MRVPHTLPSSGAVEIIWLPPGGSGLCLCPEECCFKEEVWTGKCSCLRGALWPWDACWEWSVRSEPGFPRAAQRSWQAKSWPLYLLLTVRAECPLCFLYSTASAAAQGWNYKLGAMCILCSWKKSQKGYLMTKQRLNDCTVVILPLTFQG